MARIEHDPEAQEIQAEIAALNRQFAGRRFPQDEKERWNELNERLEELTKRNARLAELEP
jgi:DNA repair exonuclease SbcCD ATPase subunit